MLIVSPEPECSGYRMLSKRRKTLLELSAETTFIKIAHILRIARYSNGKGRHQSHKGIIPPRIEIFYIIGSRGGVMVEIYFNVVTVGPADTPKPGGHWKRR